LEARLSTAQAIYETDGPLATLTFNRPDARNAMTWEMYEALVEACHRVDGDASVRVLILRGAGDKAFIAGTDIAQFKDFDRPEDGVGYEQRLDEVLDRLERVTKPTIAQVQGVAAGGGCAIALCCDLRVATPDASFGVPIARTLGNCLSADTCNRMVSLMGPARFKELMFTGRLMSAAEALAAGLVNRIVDAADLERTVRDLATEIASRAPLTIRAIKEITRRLLAKQRLAPGEDRDLIELCYTSADFKEGVSAFLAKRPPRWTGR
jgi:enoyl-CoA hydratase/carnithine racemase